ncbi:MAG: ParB/RepB/Spo0J family partition protein [Oscillospiraceae bacterium]|nr:ParB/RepB/Spo0J family partition protein [Oscillospiraceae bacterium]
MAASIKKRGLFDNQRVVSIPVGDIVPNPAQPRKLFDSQALFELSESIARYGIIQPLSVRKIGRQYELVAGERRLRAAKMAGLTEVPCIILELSGEDSSVIALIENIQRRDLDYIEEAEALAKLIKDYGMSQEEAAKRISRSQSAVANKLRILKLSPEILYVLRESGLTERHARALLRLPTEELRQQALEHMVVRQLTVAKSEEYIEDLLDAAKEEEDAAKKKRPSYIIKDVRLFLNSINRSLGIMRDSGVPAVYDKSETDEDIILMITIPKKKNVG